MRIALLAVLALAACAQPVPAPQVAQSEISPRERTEFRQFLVARCQQVGRASPAMCSCVADFYAARANRGDMQFARASSAGQPVSDDATVAAAQRISAMDAEARRQCER
jgi:hypothetical protein